jgi:hypothetical protein
MADGRPVDDDAATPAQGERSQAEQDFLIRQSMVGELEEFFPPEFLDKVRTRFEARLAERAQSHAPEAQRPADEPSPTTDGDHGGGGGN